MMKIMIIGAHPDDPEIMLGGMALKMRGAGNELFMLSMTDGSAGHHETWGEPLKARRAREAKHSAAVLGADYHIMPFKDGGLSPSVENRNELIKVMRKFAPDLVFTHPNLDYHPDHRYTCQLVMDTSYMLNVPAVAEEEKIPGKEPAYFFSVYKKTPGAFAFSIDDVWERKISALACHESQMYEWLPWGEGKINEVPEGKKERLRWLSRRRSARYAAVADEFREQLGEFVKLAEAFVPAPVGKTLAREEFEKIKIALADESKAQHNIHPS